MTLQELGFHKVAGVNYEHLMTLPAKRLRQLELAYAKGIDNTNAC